jgi:hypothetical protein
VATIFVCSPFRDGEENIVTSLSLAAALQFSLLATGAETYADAHRATQQTGQPMVVIVGAEWCPACVVMKNAILPQVRQHGLLSRVAFAVVDLDQDERLGRQLIEGGPIPQLIMYRRQNRGGWLRSKLVGRQSVANVEQFITRGVVASQGPAQQATPQAATQPASAFPATNQPASVQAAAPASPAPAPAAPRQARPAQQPVFPSSAQPTAMRPTGKIISPSRG